MPAMFLDELPTETVTQIFLSLPTVSSALALSSTCHRFRHIFSSSKKLVIMSAAAEREYGPLQDIIQLVTHNASQPAHLPRSAPLSDALIRSIVNVGRVASRWEDVYPCKKWKLNYEDRRLLHANERFVLRRALYRLWLFTRAFHNREHPRTLRSTPLAVRERAALLQNFADGELAEILDVHNVLRAVLASDICPSNGTVRRKFHNRFPDSTHQLLFDGLDYPVLTSSFVAAAAAKPHHRHYDKYAPSRTHEPGCEGWGDDIAHYYVVEDMLKLDPAQVLHLREHAPYKGQVEAYVRELGGCGGGGGGEWFDNNGETFAQTLGVVVQQRGWDADEFAASVDDGVMGIVAAC